MKTYVLGNNCVKLQPIKLNFMQQVAKLISSKQVVGSKGKENELKSFKLSNTKEKTAFQLECEKGIPASEVFDKLLKKLASLEWKK